MNRSRVVVLLAISLVVGSLTSCSSGEVEEVIVEEDGGVSSPTEESEEENEDKTYLFKSEDGEGVVEYMRSTITADGPQDWYYFTSKNEKEIKLGSREEAGFEVVYFFGKPKELYWIYGSECGFTLSDETRKKSQWYGQVEPKCSEDMFK